MQPVVVEVLTQLITPLPQAMLALALARVIHQMVVRDLTDQPHLQLPLQTQVREVEVPGGHLVLM
jgi:hypothetical protein